jgi:uncharacterized membrane protein YdbT with pleckstrin-like domain
MDLHEGETLLFEGRPSWRSILGFYIVGWLLAVAIGVIVKFADKTSTGVIVGIVGVLLVLLVGFLKRVGTRYAITDQRLHIRQGIVARRVQETRLDRVQNVNTNHSVFERLLQVGTVDFDTAGSDDYEFSFVGVADPQEVVQAVHRAQRQADTLAAGTG